MDKNVRSNAVYAEFAYNPQEARDERGEWTGGGAGPSVGTTKDGKPNAKFVDMNMGITPNRGKPATDVKSTEGYYTSTRYKGWLTDLKAEAERYNVKLKDVVRVSVVWEGAVEPSASVWANGSKQNILKLAKSMGAEYNQDGVMMFLDEDNGVGALYTMPGLKEADRDKAVQAMGKNGVSGGRVVQMRDGGYVLEVADEDGSLFDGVQALSKELGTDMFATPGSVSFLNAGEHYDKKPRPYQGTAQTPAHKELDPVAQSARKLRGAAKFALTFFADMTKPKSPPKDWGRDKKWQQAGITVHKLPANHTLLMMRGGYMGDTPAPGEPVEVYNDQNQWQGTTDTGEGLVALSGALQSGLGQVNEGAQVIQVGTQGTYEESQKSGVMRGMEVDASLVRCKHAGSRIVGKQDAGANAKGKGTDISTQAKMGAVYVDVDYADGYARFGGTYLGKAGEGSYGIAGIHFDPNEPRDFHGRWAATGVGKMGGAMRVGSAVGGLTQHGGGGGPITPTETYTREQPTDYGELSPGPEAGTYPMVEATDAALTKGVETMRLYGAPPEKIDQNINEMYGRMITKRDAATVKGWRQWYYDVADLSDQMAELTGTSHEQAAIAIAALSPQAEWGTPKWKETLKGNMSNQMVSFKVLNLVGRRGDEVMDVTPDMVAKLGKLTVPPPISYNKDGTPKKAKEKNVPLNVKSYNGEEQEYAGMDVTGKHKVKDLPSDVLSVLTQNDFRGIGGNVAKAIMGVRSQDPNVLGGPKTRSFYNNIRFPETSTDSTMDVFMMRMLTNHPDLMDEDKSTLGAEGPYKVMADAIGRAATRVGWKPHELQAALWEEEHMEANEKSGLYAPGEDHSTDYYKKAIEARAGRINSDRVAHGQPAIIFDDGIRKQMKKAGVKPPSREGASWRGKYLA